LRWPEKDRYRLMPALVALASPPCPAPGTAGALAGYLARS